MSGKDNLRELLADLAHQQWSGWIDYEFSRCDVNEDGSLTIPREWVERWRRQMNTPYSELSEAEKDSDRAEADRVLAILDREAEG